MKKNKYKILILVIIVMIIMNGVIRPMPKGLSYESDEKNTVIEFLYDLTYIKDDEYVMDQQIFNEQIKLIKEAQDFILIDMFLFNDDFDRKINIDYPEISKILTNALVQKKKENPNINILFITDEINNFYGVYESPYIKKLRENNISVVITDLEKLRDSNLVYSGIWRSLIKWFGTSGKGWISNPFSPDSPDVTLRGYLKLLNFKANHRKVIITENGAILSSMNPHNASGYHSNIGFKVKGDIIEDMILSELEVAKLSGYSDVEDFVYINKNNIDDCNSKVKLITEGKIKENILNALRNTIEGDKIKIALFYLSERDIIKELINASNKGVEIKIILDANKDAFGRKKNGIPNRQVAYELKKKSNDNIQIRWYDTHGEQFHTKLIIVENKNETTVIGGSANLTRRNIDNYNIESNLMIKVNNNTNLYNEVEAYFNRIYNNIDGNYTVEYEKFEDTSLIKTIIYRLQESSGISTF